MAAAVCYKKYGIATVIKKTNLDASENLEGIAIIETKVANIFVINVHKTLEYRMGQMMEKTRDS